MLFENFSGDPLEALVGGFLEICLQLLIQRSIRLSFGFRIGRWFWIDSIVLAGDLRGLCWRELKYGQVVPGGKIEVRGTWYEAES